MPSWSNCKDRVHIRQQSLGSERLDLTDLLEVSDLLLRHGALSFRVAGWSMYPTLGKGDRLTVEPASASHLHVGDLVLFHIPVAEGARLVCHRLVAVEDTGPAPRLITRGDAVTGDGEVIQPNQVVGRVVAVKRPWWLADGSPWIATLMMRLDRIRDRLAYLIIRGVRALQKLRLLVSLRRRSPG